MKEEENIAEYFQRVCQHFVISHDEEEMGRGNYKTTLESMI